jgi:hypothetical protein
MTTTQNPNPPRWISLPPAPGSIGAASTDDLEAALAARREQEAAAERAAAEQAAERARTRKKRLAELPRILDAWRARIADLAGTETGRPAGILRGRARALLLPSEQSAAEWPYVLQADAVAAELRRISQEAGLLMLELANADEQTLAAIDGVECAAFSALYDRVHVLAGVTR